MFLNYDMANQKTYSVDAAHTNKITGIVNISPTMVFSVALDGSLKVWELKEEKLFLNQEATDKFLAMYSTGQNMKIELLFIDYTLFNEIPVVSVGTSDNRLLLWTGNNLDFKQALFG